MAAPLHRTPYIVVTDMVKDWDLDYAALRALEGQVRPEVFNRIRRAAERLQAARGDLALVKAALQDLSDGSRTRPLADV